MKQTNIQITFEEEKLRALRRYIAKRDSTLEAELQKAAQRLYEKVVPAAVQEYISDCTQDDPDVYKRQGLLIAVLALTQLGLFLPMVLVAAYAFLSIHLDGLSVLDFLSFVVSFYITEQQIFEWEDPT